MTAIAFQTDDVPYQRERRLIARLAGGRQMPTVGVSTGRPAWTDSEIAAGLSGIVGLAPDGRRVPDKLGRGLVLYLWAQQREQEGVILAALGACVAVWATNEGWRVPRQGWLGDLARTALLELHNRRQCGECSATGRLFAPGHYRHVENEGQVLREWVPGGYVLCERCRGQGAFRWSLRERAFAVGHLNGRKIHHTSWRESWDDRYERILAFIQRREYRALRQFRVRLSSSRDA